MARTPIIVPPPDFFAAAGEPPVRKKSPHPDALDEWIAKPKAPKRKPTVSPKQREMLKAQLKEMFATGDWSDGTPRHLVALYAWCHEQVYGIAPAELDGATFIKATGMAARMLEREFKGEIDRAVDFVRWAWKREEAREKWRRENGRDGGRVGWQLQFGGALLTDYRIDLARKAKGTAR